MITPFYAALLTIFYIGLSLYVVHGRMKYKISLYDGGDRDMARRIRAHANFAEYVPLALLLLFFVEYAGGAAWILHALGLSLFVGRLVHALAFGQLVKIPFGRQAGMVLTLTPMIVAALTLLWQGF